MVEKRPSPFSSPFSRLVLGVLTLGFAGAFAYSLTTRDINGIIATTPGFFIIPWLAWNLLSGVQVRPGQSVGGGPMYPRCDLQLGETILFDAPAILEGGLLSRMGGHIFITNQRIVALPIRFYGKVRTIPLEQMSSVRSQESGVGWPLPRQSITVVAGAKTLTLRPWTGAKILPLWFMGMISGDAFVTGVMDAVQRAGWTPPRDSPDF
jgi:hypothetical protein